MHQRAQGILRTLLIAVCALLAQATIADPYPPYWGSSAVHFPPVAWPNEPADPKNCGASCGDWLPYTRFQQGVGDPRTQDPSNGGTAPQNYVNIASSCTDKAKPSIYYALRQGAAVDGSQDVIMFRWRVEQIANTYATGPSAGSYGASDPWNSALWTVLFDVNGDGFVDLAAHLDGSSGAPATAIDRIAGIWSKLPTQSLDYIGDAGNVKLIAHNPTAFVDPVSGRILNFQGSVTPVANWPLGAAETTWDYGTTRSKVITTSPCNEYFIDYQIPVKLLDASSLGGPKITRSTPISMLFCTANSLNNPFQKDCAINRSWIGAAGKPGPFGDYISFDQAAPYAQPIVSSVSATAPSTCPGTYALTATVQDTLAVVNGAVVPSVKAVRFYYYYDANGNGIADDGNAWTFAAAATLKPGSLNTWTASWDATALARGQYLIGVQALDDNAMVDDGVTPTGVDNRTFSYVTGDAQNRIRVGGVDYVSLPPHSPVMTPSATENWWSNPSVTGTQTALVGVALNACGLAPTIVKTANVANATPGSAVDFTLTIANPLNSSITLSRIDDTLPAGFTYSATTGGTLSPSTSPVNGATGAIAWTFAPALSLASGSSQTLTFRTSAPAVSGNYNNAATATTSFGTLTSAPVAIAVDAARLSLAKTPSTYAIAPDGATQLVYTLSYSNDATVPVSSAVITDALPAGVTYVACTGGTSCGNASGTVTWTIGAIAPGASGSVSLTVTVNNGYAGTSLANSATISGNDPAGTPVTKSASSTIAVTTPGATSPAFTLAKNASASQVAPGGSVTWTLAYTNYGTANATGVTITDALPAGFTFASCTGGASCANSGGTVTWNVGNVSAGASGSVTVTASAANPFNVANPAMNSASLQWTGNPGSPVSASSQVGITGNACSTYYYHADTINVGTGADGGVRRIATTTAPTSGTAATIGFNATTTPVEAVRFFQDPPTTTDVSFSGNITTSFYVTKSSGPQLKMDVYVYDYDPGTGAKVQLGTQSFTQTGSGTNQLFTFTLPLSGTLQKGHRILWIFNAYSNNNTTFTFNFDGTASPSGASFCVTPPANLTLQKSVDKASVTGGSASAVQYTLRFTNTGQSKATGTTVTDNLPANVTFVSATLNGSSVSPGISGQQLTFGNIQSSTDAVAGEVSGGASGTIVINATIGASASGTLTNDASISSAQTLAVLATASTDVITAGGGGTPALAVSLAADRTSAAPGDTVTYTVTIVNTGSGTASNVQAADVLPIAAYYGFGTCSGGCSNSSGTLSWSLGSLAPGAVATRTFTMLAASSGLPAGITVIPDAASATATGVSSVNSNTVNVSLNGNPNLTLAKSANPVSGLLPGNTITYSMTVGNAGSAAATGVVVIDAIPASTAYAGNLATSAGSAAFDAVNNRVRIDVGTLAAGASVTASFDVTVAALPAGATTIANTATASAANATTRTASASASASAAPSLIVAKRAPAAVPYPAATLAKPASGASFVVGDASQLAIGSLVSVAGNVVTITGISGNTVSVSGAINAAATTPVIAAVPYVITYQNVGTATALNTVISDVLPAGVLFAGASNGGVLSAGTVTWSAGDVAPGAQGTVQLALIPNGPGAINNAASATCSGCNTPVASALTSAGGLRVTKRTTTPVAVAGGSATYILEIENTSSGAIGGVTATDTLAPGFAYGSTTSITNNGVAASATSMPAPGDTSLAWGTFTVGAGAKLAITFVANIASTTGAATYQNDASALPAASTVAFDPLSTTAEDVTVLASGTGMLDGYVFVDINGNGTYDAGTDTPLTGVRVDITDSTSTLYSVITDGFGHFQRVVAAGSATLDVNDADLPPGMAVAPGSSDPSSAVVPSGGAVTRSTGYVSASSLVPDLAITKTHAGSFTQGQVGATYSIGVSNVGTGSTSGAVSVTDTVPTGLTVTAIAGNGWSCTVATASCTRSDSLAPSASYPPITVTVNVAGNAASSLVNSAAVSGGGDLNAANNSANDTTSVLAGASGPDLTIAVTHGAMSRGAAGAVYSLLVSNIGGTASSGVVTVADTLPPGLSALSMAGPGWTCSVASITCTRSDALAPGASYPAIVLIADVGASAATMITDTASVSGGGDTVLANNSAADVAQLPSSNPTPASIATPIPALGPALLVLLVLLLAMAAAREVRRTRRHH